MEEIEEWFISEYGHLGFDVSPTIYDPITFAPSKMIFYNDGNTRMRITCELVNLDYRALINQGVDNFLRINGFIPITENRLHKTEFIPKKLTKHKFK